MPKTKLKAWLPKPEDLQKNKVIRLFAPFLADARLWHLNRTSLSRAVYIGVLCAYFPLPGQMPLAIIGALLFRANIAMSVGLTWLTNPITTIPIFWGAYYVGAKLLGEPVIGVSTIGAMLADITRWLFDNGNNPFIAQQFFSLKAFVLGLVVMAILTSVILGVAFNLFWRYKITKNWQKRAGYQPNTTPFASQPPKKRDL